MPRNITVTLADGSQHTYANAPDDITPAAVTARAMQEFNQSVTNLDGGNKPQAAAPAAAPTAAPAQAPSTAPAAPASDSNVLTGGRFPNKGEGGYDDFIKAGYRTDANGAIIGKAQEQAEKIKAAGQSLADQDKSPFGDIFSAGVAGVRKASMGLADRAAAAGEKYLPAHLNVPLLGDIGTGNDSNASYDDILKVIRARNDAETNKSLLGNVIGQVLGGGGILRAAGGLAARGAGALMESGAPLAEQAGNYLQSAMTMKKGQTLANAAKVVGGGALAGGAQAAGDDQNVATGAMEGAAGAAVLGGGFKAIQAVTRPFRDFLRLPGGIGDKLLGRLTSASKDQLEAAYNAKLAANPNATPTLFELLPLQDRNKILKTAVVGRDPIVEQASGLIRDRAETLGPQMQARANDILTPGRNTEIGAMHQDLAEANGGIANPADAGTATAAASSPTDLLALRDQEARAIMAPHDNTTVSGSVDDLYPHVETTDAKGNVQRVSTDPEVQAVIRGAAGTLTKRAQGSGVNASEVSDMIQTIKKDLGGGAIDAGTARRAIDHLEGELAVSAPEAADAHQQMTDAYAARSRQAEGMAEGMQTRMRNSISVGTNRGQAQTVRNAYDTPEGASGRQLGQGNQIIGSLAGSPEEALRSTVGLSRNSIGPELSQNLGSDNAKSLMDAARATDESASALSAASTKAQAGGDGAGGIEALVQGLVGLHPGGFITTKLGAISKLGSLGIPQNRAKTMVNMIFSQDPAMVRKALTAVGNTPNGSGVLSYLTKATAQTLGGSDNNPTPDPSTLAPPSAAPAQQAAPDPADPALAPAPDAPQAAPQGQPQGQPIDEASSPYAEKLQHIYDTENPDLLNLVSRVGGQESGGRQHDAQGRTVVSKKGAVGVMQVMPDTAPEAARLAGVPYDENSYKHDPAYNKLIGIAYLSQLLRQYGGNVAKATAAYNAGQGRVNAAVRKGGEASWLNHVPAETQDYVQKVA